MRSYRDCGYVMRAELASGYRFSVFPKASRGWNQIESVPDLLSAVGSVSGGSDLFVHPCSGVLAMVNIMNHC